MYIYIYMNIYIYIYVYAKICDIYSYSCTHSYPDSCTHSYEFVGASAKMYGVLESDTFSYTPIHINRNFIMFILYIYIYIRSLTHLYT